MNSNLLKLRVILGYIFGLCLGVSVVLFIAGNLAPALPANLGASGIPISKADNVRYIVYSTVAGAVESCGINMQDKTYIAFAQKKALALQAHATKRGPVIATYIRTVFHRAFRASMHRGQYAFKVGDDLYEMRTVNDLASCIEATGMFPALPELKKAE